MGLEGTKSSRSTYSAAWTADIRGHLLRVLYRVRMRGSVRKVCVSTAAAKDGKKRSEDDAFRKETARPEAGKEREAHGGGGGWKGCVVTPSILSLTRVAT